MGEHETVRRFFVRIEARDEKALVALRKYGMDLFRASAVRAAAAMRTALEAGAPSPPLAVEGLLTLAQVERLALEGYRVTIDGEASRRAGGRVEVVEFEDWLKGMED